MPIDGKHSALQEIGNALGSEYDQFRPFFRRYRNICQYCPFRQQYCWCSILIIGATNINFLYHAIKVVEYGHTWNIGPLVRKKSACKAIVVRCFIWQKCILKWKKNLAKKKSSLRNFPKISYVTFLFVLDNVITEHLALGGKIFWAWFRQYVVEWEKAFYQ